MPKTTWQETGVTLGGVIAHFRQRLHRAYSSLPWSQEDLALAIGAYQTHVSRIESNQLHPEYSTLARICDALDLSVSERKWVMSLAGYQEIAPLPDEDEVRSVVAKLIPRLESLPYPATLTDEGERIWYYNRIGAIVHGPSLGAEDHEALLTRVRGKRYLGLIFPSDVYERWRTHWEDPDLILTRQVASFWRSYRIRPQDPDMTRVLEALKKCPEFLHCWERIESGERDSLFVEQCTYAFRHPKLGRIRCHAWRTHYSEDERFIVGHLTPMDSPTGRVFERLARHLKPVTSSKPDQTELRACASKAICG